MQRAKAVPLRKDKAKHKKKLKWRTEEQEDTSSYWMAVRKRGDPVNWKRKP